MSIHFHQLKVGQKFQGDCNVFTKTGKSSAENGGLIFRINSQALVTPVEVEEKPWKKLNPHTTEFTTKQLAGVIEAIIERAQKDYGASRINDDRLRKGLYCAHRAKPIRLNDLLNTCHADFPSEILYGVYRHYDKATDTMKNGWTAQHA